MNARNETQYALVWAIDPEMKNTVGTSAEVAREYLKAIGHEIKIDANEDWPLACFTRLEGDEWQFVDPIEDQGSPEANLEEGYRLYFDTYINPLSGEDYDVYELTTQEQIEAFIAPIDDLLDKISFKEARDNDLDPEYDENGLRAWYYEHKVA